MMRQQILDAMRGQRALITGGSKGFGEAIAKTFAELGVDVGIIGRDEKGLARVKAEVEKQGVDCLVIKADLATPKGVEQAAKTALAHAAQWDILVNNAGYAKPEPLLEASMQEFDYTIAVNTRAALHLTQLIAPQMVKRKRGKVINISSLGAFIATPGLANYALSKAALNQLTRSMAVELGDKGINVNAICPTIILTKLAKEIWDSPEYAELRQTKLDKIPLHRFGEPQEVADLVLFLASSAADFINGVCIPLDGGVLASS